MYEENDLNSFVISSHFKRDAAKRQRQRNLNCYFCSRATTNIANADVCASFLVPHREILDLLYAMYLLILYETINFRR